MQTNNTILIVDDERGILETYRQYLGSEPTATVFRTSRRPAPDASAPRGRPHYDLLLAENGEAAVALVEREREAGRRIAAGFFDMKMPGGIDGLETIRRVRGIDPDILCGVVTAYQDRSIDDINELFRPGREDEWDYISKPFTQSEIQQKARNLVSSWHRRRQQEERQRDLERLIDCLSQVKGMRGPDLLQFMEHVLKQLASFTESSAGMLLTLEGGVAFRAGVGRTASREEAAIVLARPGMIEAIEHSAQKAEIEGSADISVIPFSGARGRRIAVLLHGQKPSDDRRRLMRVFAENASAAMENADLYDEIRSINESLAERVATQTEDIRSAHDTLKRRTEELEQTLHTLKETERQLVLNEKLAIVGQLAAGVAHEVNNPLAFIMANLSEMRTLAGLLPEYRLITGADASPRLQDWPGRKQFGLLTGEFAEMTTDSLEGVARIATIVDELRTLGRPDVGSREPVRVEVLLDKALRILDNQARHRTQIVRRFGKTPAVSAHAGQLLQVFLNLLVNAIHALRFDDRAQNLIEVETALRGDEVEISVRDNGTGITPANMAKLFEPFFTTKGPRDGTGLGLSISRTIVQRHGGSVHVESRLGQGALFVVRLPLETPRESVEGGDARPVSAGEAHVRILLVDDDSHVRDGVQRMLRSAHSVVAVAGGAAALDALAGVPAFDVVLCDLMMPGMPGHELYRQAAARFPGMERRFLFLTGGAFQADAQEFAEQVRERCVAKPLSREALLAAIAKVVEGGPTSGAAAPSFMSDRAQDGPREGA